MKDSRLIAATMALLMIFACFISVPVFAEGPFDVDEAGDTDGVSSDTSDTDGDNVLLQEDNDDKLDWNQMLIKIIVRVIINTISHSGLVNAQG
ncbi:MAG: hypothetical protein KOO62_09670 [candidate division Zixibacteria bacterium]|nr:hypothetical protein [candidate division Zixibacteria bacterium]